MPRGTPPITENETMSTDNLGPGFQLKVKAALAAGMDPEENWVPTESPVAAWMAENVLLAAQHAVEVDGTLMCFPTKSGWEVEFMSWELSTKELRVISSDGKVVKDYLGKAMPLADLINTAFEGVYAPGRQGGEALSLVQELEKSAGRLRLRIET